MDVLFVGLGSIGTRHLKNLHAVAAQKGIPVRAWALRSSARALPEETRALLAEKYPCPNTPAMTRRSSRTRRTCISGCYKICGAKRILFL